MNQGAEGKKLTNVFKKLERLEEHVEYRRNLVASLVQTEEVLKEATSCFGEKKLALEEVIKNHGRPMNLPSGYSKEEEMESETAHPTPVVPVAPMTPRETPEQRFVDATNLCLLFKAFQPFLDRNTPHDAAVDILHSILHPVHGEQVYKHFAVEPVCAATVKTAQRRQRRRNLRLFQRVEQSPDGGVPDAKLKVVGHDGEVTPLAFKTVLRYLTQCRIEDRHIRTLFSYFDVKDKVVNEAVNLNHFLDGLDEIMQDNSAELLAACFESVCAPHATVLSRGDIYEHIVPSGKLSTNQAHCLLDHFPPEPPIPRLPPLKQRRDNEKHKLLRLEVSGKLVRAYREGATMTRRQFGTAFEESPFLLICFLDIVLCFAASVISRETARGAAKLAEQRAEDPVVAVYKAFYYPEKKAKRPSRRA